MMLSHLIRWLDWYKARAIAGHIDHVDGEVLRGWAWNAKAPTERVVLDVFHRGVFLGSARTGSFRQDLVDQKIGDGHYGFAFRFPRDSATPISPSDIELQSAERFPIRLRVTTPIGPSRTSAVRRGRNPPSDPKSFFGPLIDELGARRAEARASSCVEPRRQVDMLCRPSSRERSAFAEHIARKYDRASDDDDTFWAWYLEKYMREKADQDRVPLSALDQDMIRARHAPAGSLPVTGGPRSSAIRSNDAYDWAAHGAKRLFIEDCLIENRDISELREVADADEGMAFPLSRFMKCFAGRHQLLKRLSPTSEDQRARLYVVLILFGLRDPHYLCFMPQSWLNKALCGDAGDTIFEGEQRKLFGTSSRGIPRDVYIRHLEANGFSFKSGRLEGTAYGPNRVKHGATILSEGRVDLQIIGPFSRSLGLAESCRRLARALQVGFPNLKFVDYDISSAPRISGEFPLSPIGPARINIIHLNAEEVPEAIAYCADGFSSAHNILVPYWELSHPSAAQHLGLALVDEIWTTSHFLENVFSGGKPCAYIGMSADERPSIAKTDARAFVESLGAQRDRFTFLTTADALSWTRRKNVVGVLEAFIAAFPDDTTVQLVVKLRNVATLQDAVHRDDYARIMSLCRSDERIVVVDVDLSAEEQRTLLAGADCLVSLHRAEGLGLDLLDAMATGVAVVCTAYSGNCDFCTPSTSWLVDCDLRPVGAHEYAFVEAGHVWAEPRSESAIRALQDVVGHRENRERRVALAQRQTRIIASPAAFADRLAALVHQRLSGPLKS